MKEDTAENRTISVIIPAFNRPESLRNFLETVKKQSYKHLELIVADDCSDVPLSDVVADYPEVIYLRNEKNLGYSANMINAMKYASGAFIHFASDDDEMGESCFFENAMERFDSCPETDAVFSRLEILSSYRNIVNRKDFSETFTPEEFFEMLKSIRFSFLDYFALSTFVFKKELLHLTAPFVTETPESNSIDISTIIKYTAACRRIDFIDCVGYRWQKFTPDSLGNAKKDDLAYQTLCSVSAVVDVYRHFNGSGKYKDLLNAYVEYIFQAILADYYSLNIEEKIKEIPAAVRGQRVYVYCRGWVGLRIEDHLRKNGINILAFIEDFKSANEDTVSFEKFLEDKRQCTVIIASTKHRDVLNIYKKLNRLANITIIDLI